jgi:hypothetical protein
VGLDQFVKIVVPIPISLVEDAEGLIRRVPADLSFYGTDPTTGDLRVSLTAFNDRWRKPSVDRQAMLATLDAAKLVASDGLVRLLTHEVRAIELAQVVNGKLSDKRNRPVTAY